MEYVGMMKAPTPVTAFSFQVKIVNSWFKGSSGMILPDGSLFAMESSWHAINNMDLTKGNTDRNAADTDRPAGAISVKEREALLAKKPGFWTWKKAASGVATLAVVGVVASQLLGTEKTPPAGTTPDPDPGPDTKKANSFVDDMPSVPN